MLQREWDEPRQVRRKSLLIALLTVLVLIAVGLHLPFVNGPTIASLSWRRFTAGSVYPYFAIPLGLAALAQFAWLRKKSLISLLLIFLAALSLRFAAVTSGPTSGLYLARWIMTRTWTSTYFAEAQKLDISLRSSGLTLSQFVSDFPSHMHDMGIHARIRPPGLTLLNLASIRTLGAYGNHAVDAMIWLYALVSAAAPLACYWMMRVLRFSRDASFAGAMILAIVPGPALHFPTVDSCYPTITCCLVALWGLSLHSRTALFATLFGLLLSATLFATYNFLVLGVFFAGLSLLRITKNREDIRRVVACIAITIGTVFLAFFLLKLITGFPAIQTFRTALHNEWEFRDQSHRAGGFPFGWDLYTFALTAGFLPVLLIVFALSRNDRPHRVLIWLGIIQILIVDLTRLLAYETSRVWIFLLPFLMLGAGTELARWPTRYRLLTVLCLIIISACYCQNLQMW